MYSTKSPWDMSRAEIAADIATCEQEITICDAYLESGKSGFVAAHRTHRDRCKRRILDLNMYA